MMVVCYCEVKVLSGIVVLMKGVEAGNCSVNRGTQAPRNYERRLLLRYVNDAKLCKR